MNILDLNHIEAVEGTEVLGGGYYPYSYYTYYQNDKVALDVDTYVYVDDNSAEAFADSYAYGNNSFTKTFTNTYASDYSSQSNSGSFAAVD